jgi:hypothetical protein
MALRTQLERSGERASRPPERDPANELYDEACALVAAAQGLRAAAGPRPSAPARNARLAAIRSLYHYAAIRHPEHTATIARPRPGATTARSSATSTSRRPGPCSPPPMNAGGSADTTTP